MQNLFRARMAGWLLTSLALFLIIAAMAPQQILVGVFKFLLVSAGGVSAYWLDRHMFFYARPDAFLVQPFSPGAPYVPGRAVQPGMEVVFAAAMIRRAIIVGAAMLAIGMGA